MALSAIERINNINAKPENATKGITDVNFPFFGYGSGLDSSNRDLTHTEQGAAQASQLLVDIAAPLSVWEQWLDSITWHIKDINTGETIISTDERKIPDDNQPGLRTFRAIKQYRDRFNHSYWKSIAVSDWIAGETYIKRVRNQSNIPTMLQWLNPLATEPNIISGRIRDYRYSNDDMQEVGHLIPATDMAFRMLRRNLFDDLRGYAPVMSVIDESNLSRNVKRAFRQYFRNGMILGGLIAPDGENTFSPREINEIEGMLTRNHRGVGNAHSWIISPKKFFAEQFTQKDVAKDINILNDLRGSIMMAMGVPEELAGNPTNATYENLEATQYGWYKLKGIPYAKDVAEYHNNQIIPFLDGDRVYIEPELSKYEIERPEVVSQDVTASVISLYDAQIKRGQTEADEQLKDIYIVNNRPMHRDVIVKLANTMPSEEIQQRANAEESLANAEAKPVEAEAQATEATQPEPVIEAPTLPEPVADSETVTEQKSVTVSHGDHDHVIPVADSKAYSHDHALSELKAWKKFRKNDPSRDFVPEYLLGDVADSIRAAIASGDDIEPAFDSAFETLKAWQKAIQSVRIDFEDDFDDIMEKARTEGNNYGRVQWSTAVRKIIRRACERAYSDGLVAGGVLDGELSESDADTLAAHLAEQSQYVSALGAKIFKTEDGISDALAEQKAPMWFNKSVLPMFDAGRGSADANGMYEFAGQDGEQSCSTCPRLKGQRHRFKDWTRKGLRPGVDTENFECGGWQCKHKLVKVAAKARGNW